jgi:hypothetical protein
MIKKVEGLPSWLETIYHRMEETTTNHDSSTKKKKPNQIE